MVYGIFAPKTGAVPVEPSPPKVGGLVGMVLLGMIITAMELVTALPYFAATTLMTFAQLPAGRWLPLLLAYNAIFVAPPLLLLGLHVLLGRRLGDRYPRWCMTLQRGAREATLWIVAIVGVALAGDAIGRYLGKRGGVADVQATVSEIACGSGVEALPAVSSLETRPATTALASSARVRARPSGALDWLRYFDIFGNMKGQDVVDALGALAQESRLAVYRLLVRRGPEGLAVGEIGDALRIPGPTLSFHLKELAQAGLVTPRKEGRFVYYAANFGRMNLLLAYLTENCCGDGVSCGPGVAAIAAPRSTRRKVSA